MPRTRIAVVILFAIMATLMIGCSDSQNLKVTITKIADNLYYFDTGSAGAWEAAPAFQSALQKFLSDHPDLKVISITSNQASDTVYGYWVTFKEK